MTGHDVTHDITVYDTSMAYLAQGGRVRMRNGVEKKKEPRRATAAPPTPTAFDPRPRPPPVAPARPRISCHVISFLIISYHTIPYHIISYHIISFYIAQPRSLPPHIISYHIARAL